MREREKESECESEGQREREKGTWVSGKIIAIYERKTPVNCVPIIVGLGPCVMVYELVYQNNTSGLDE